MIHPGGFWLRLSVIRMMMMAFLSLFNQIAYTLLLAVVQAIKRASSRPQQGAFCGLHLRLSRCTWRRRFWRLIDCILVKSCYDVMTGLSQPPIRPSVVFHFHIIIAGCWNELKIVIKSNQHFTLIHFSIIPELFLILAHQQRNEAGDDSHYNLQQTPE